MTTTPVSDPAAPRFDAAFETLHWRHGRLLRLAAHRHRLDATLAVRRLSAPDWAVVRAEVEARARDLFEARVRVTVPFEARGSASFTCDVAPLPESFAGRRAGIVAVTRAVPGADAFARAAEKLVSRRDALRRLADAASPAEALLVDPDGRVLEGATWNVFAVVGGRLRTPATGPQVLGGTVRAAVLDAAVGLGFEPVVGPLPLDALWRASEVFATNALLPLAPLCSLDGRELPPPGACLRALLEVVDGEVVA